MKILLSAALLLLLASCNNQPNSNTTGMSGVYKMLSQTVQGGKTDTTFNSLMQQKIYTDHYMMYANFNPSDSASSFGIGTYTYNKDTLIEKVFFSGSDSIKFETLRNYKLLIEKTKQGYKQVIPEIESQGVKFRLTEDYENISDSLMTPLDGAWEMESQVNVKGKDSTIVKGTQFKVYHAGHFIWARSYTDSSGRTRTGMGFGTFTLKGTDQLKEHVAVSSYYQIRLQDIDIAVELSGSDGFKQTITNKEDSSLSIETYKRLKK